MKAPQQKAGYTRIPNKMIEKLAGIRISGEEIQCLWVILRKTYGWGKTEDTISLGQFMAMTSIEKPNILRALNKLLSKMIIVVNIDNEGMKIYKINKDLDEWLPLSILTTKGKALSILTTGVVNIDNRSISRVKETLTKEILNICGFAKLWNRTITGNLPKIRRPDRLNNSRQNAIRKAWLEYSADLEDWRQIFQALSESQYHQGQNDTGWIADFDWIMDEKNYPRFHDRSAMPKIQNIPPAKVEQLSTYVGANDQKEKTPEEWELHELRRQRAFAKRGNMEELTPDKIARLKELEELETAAIL